MWLEVIETFVMICLSSAMDEAILGSTTMSSSTPAENDHPRIDIVVVS